MIDISKINGQGDGTFHSNGYARTAQGSAMGSSVSQTFSERHRLERNRSHVRNYASSHIANGRTSPASPLSPAGQSGRSRWEPPTRGGSHGPLPARRGFTEPPARYNPYP